MKNYFSILLLLIMVGFLSPPVQAIDCSSDIGLVIQSDVDFNKVVAEVLTFDVITHLNLVAISEPIDKRAIAIKGTRHNHRIGKPLVPWLGSKTYLNIKHRKDFTLVNSYYRNYWPKRL